MTQSGRGGSREGSGRPLSENPAKNRTIRLNDADYQNYKALGGADWLKNAIEDAINPTPTEWDNFKEYADRLGIHQGIHTLCELASLYNELKFTYGWIAIIKTFKARGQEIFKRKHELEMSDDKCKWCGKYCGGNCTEANNYIKDIKNIIIDK